MPEPRCRSLTRRTPVQYLGLLLRLALVACVVVVALVGILYITRGTAVRHVRGVTKNRVVAGESQ